jgi:hypothetical protein
VENVTQSDANVTQPIVLNPCQTGYYSDYYVQYQLKIKHFSILGCFASNLKKLIGNLAK